MEPRTAPGKALLADPFRHVMSCPAYKGYQGQSAERCSCAVGELVLEIEAAAVKDALERVRARVEGEWLEYVGTSPFLLLAYIRRDLDKWIDEEDR